MSVLPSVITSFTKLKSFSIVPSYVGCTDYLLQSNRNAEK